MMKYKYAILIIILISVSSACTMKQPASSYLNLQNDLTVTLEKSTLSILPAGKNEVIDHVGYKSWDRYIDANNTIIEYAKFKNLKFESESVFHDKFARYTPSVFIDRLRIIDYKNSEYKCDLYTLRDNEDSIKNFVLLGYYGRYLDKGVKPRPFVMSEIFTIAYDESATLRILKELGEHNIIAKKYRENEEKLNAQKMKSLSEDNIIFLLRLNQTLKYFKIDEQVDNIENYKMKIYNLTHWCYPHCKTFLELYNSEERLLMAIKIRLDKEMIVESLSLSPIIAYKHKSKDNYDTRWYEIQDPPYRVRGFWN